MLIEFQLSKNFKAILNRSKRTPIYKGCQLAEDTKKKKRETWDKYRKNGITDIIRSRSTDYFSGVKDLASLEVLSSLVKSIIKDVIFALKAFTVATASLSERLRPTYVVRPLNSLINAADSWCHSSGIHSCKGHVQ